MTCGLPQPEVLFAIAHPAPPLVSVTVSGTSVLLYTSTKSSPGPAGLELLSSERNVLLGVRVERIEPGAVAFAMDAPADGLGSGRVNGLFETALRELIVTGTDLR